MFCLKLIPVVQLIEITIVLTFRCLSSIYQGLLQSEVEGIDNDKVGFYGRCLLHATDVGCHTSDRPIDDKSESPREKDFTCGRTEVC